MFENLENGMVMIDFLGESKRLILVSKTEDEKERILIEDWSFEWDKFNWELNSNYKTIKSTDIERVIVKNGILCLYAYEKNVKILIETL